MSVLRNVNRSLQTERLDHDVTDAHMRNMTSSLFRAVVSGRMSRVRFLIGTAGVRSDVRNDLGQNLLVASLFASDNGQRRSMFNFLLKRCAVDCEKSDTTTGRDVITWAAILNRPEQVRRVNSVWYRISSAISGIPLGECCHPKPLLPHTARKKNIFVGGVVESVITAPVHWNTLLISSVGYMQIQLGLIRPVNLCNLYTWLKLEYY